jgi:hypothetical protein
MKGGRGVRLTTSQLYGPSRPVTGIALPFISYLQEAEFFFRSLFIWPRSFYRIRKLIDVSTKDDTDPHSELLDPVNIITSYFIHFNSITPSKPSFLMQIFTFGFSD